MVKYLAAGSCVAATLAVMGCEGEGQGPGQNGSEAGISASQAISQGPAPQTRVCGQAVLHSPYKYSGYHGSSITTFGSGQFGLPTFGSAGSDYPNVTKGYIVPPGDQSGLSTAPLNDDRILVYFEPGRHVSLDEIDPGDDSVYLGGYSPAAGEATLDHNHRPGTTFMSYASNVTIKYLTIKNYDGNGDADSFGGSIVDMYGGYHWTVDYNTVGPNGSKLGDPNTGYGIGVGSDSEYKYNCVIQNGEGGFNNGTATDSLKNPAPWGGPANYTIDHNEIAGNAIATCQPEWGCKEGVWDDPNGVAGGIKLFWSLNGTVNYNYVHDNYGVGIWPDTNNSGMDISYNYISNNFDGAIFYEASFNANITHNTVTGNGTNPKGPGEWAGYPEGWGPAADGGPSFVTGAIAIYSSGGSTNIQSGNTRYAGQLNVTGNHLVNNFGGIAAFQDRNRFCGEGADGGADTCTLNGTYSGGKTKGTPYYVQPTSYTDKPALSEGSASLTAIGGFDTNYDGSRTKPGPGWIVRAYNADSGDPVSGLLPDGETIASCSSNSSCTLAKAATATVSDGKLGSTPIEIETGPPGGCGMYDLIGSKAGASTGSPANPYFDNCNWWNQNLTVSGNTFVMNANPTKTFKPGSVTNCTAANGCGYMVLYASSGACTTGCFWSPYADEVSTDRIISGQAHNAFSNNTYSWIGPGAWTFEAGVTGNVLSWSDWRDSPHHQDAGSTLGR